MFPPASTQIKIRSEVHWLFFAVALVLVLAPQVNDVLKGEMSVEHTVGKSSSRATLDVEGNWMSTSSCVAVGSSFLVGAQGDFAVGAPKVCCFYTHT